MRVKYLLITVLIIMLMACVKEEDQVINAKDYYSDGSYFISLEKLESPQVRGSYCGNPQFFELRFQRDLEEYGTAIVFQDGLYLNIQYDVLQYRVDDGWGIDASLVWVGLPEDWTEGKDGPPGGWHVVPGINIIHFPGTPSTALHQIPLEDWMFDGCFTIAIRLTIRDEFGNWNGSADGFINHGDYLTFSWNEPFCLDKCIDPGTLAYDYWENNPDDWPYGIIVGGSFYSEELAIQVMQEGDGIPNDMTYSMFDQIIAAKLNIAIGNTSYCIIETLDAADIWMEEYGPVGSGVTSSSPEWNEGEQLAGILTNYNNGILCAESGQ